VLFILHLCILRSKLRFMRALMPLSQENSIFVAISCNSVRKVYLLARSKVFPQSQNSQLWVKMSNFRGLSSVFPPATKLFQNFMANFLILFAIHGQNFIKFAIFSKFDSKSRLFFRIRVFRIYFQKFAFFA